MIFHAIDSLIAYGLKKELIAPDDMYYARSL